MDIILLHGFGEDASIWNEFIELLPQQHSYFKPDYASLVSYESIEAYAEWLKEFYDKHEIKAGILIGHSMGGYIALAFAEKYPEMILGLGLFSSSSYADNEERKAGRLKTISTIEEQGSAEFIKDFYPKMFTDDFKENNKEFINKQIKKYAELPEKAFMNAQLAMCNRPDRRNILKEASYPVLIIAGEKDTFIPLSAAKEQIKLPKDSHSAVLDNVAHAGMFESPADSAKIVTDFLNAF